MNILMVHPHDIYSASEPWTIRVTSIAHEFIKKGHKVKLVYFPLSKKERGIVKSEKITEFETIPFNRSKWYLLDNISRMTNLGKWADIIYLQKCFTHASLPAIFSAYSNKKPIHYDWDDWEYGIYMYSPPSKIYGYYLNLIEKGMLKVVDSLSVASEELRKMAIKERFPKDRIIKANVCADLKRFHPSEKPKWLLEKYKGPIILYLGQLHGAQYAQLLLKTAVILLKKHPNINFIFVGGGGDKERLVKYTNDLGIEKNIIFTGFVSDAEVNDYLAVADIAVACFKDTKQVRCKSPLKIVEYLASGKAIVASNVGEIPFMIGEAGILTKPGDSHDLARGIITLLEDKNLREKLEEKARIRAEEYFDWETVSEKLLKLFYDLKFV